MNIIKYKQYETYVLAGDKSYCIDKKQERKNKDGETIFYKPSSVVLQAEKLVTAKKISKGIKITTETGAYLYVFKATNDIGERFVYRIKIPRSFLKDNIEEIKRLDKLINMQNKITYVNNIKKAAIATGFIVVGIGFTLGVAKALESEPVYTSPVKQEAIDPTGKVMTLEEYMEKYGITIEQINEWNSNQNNPDEEVEKVKGIQ